MSAPATATVVERLKPAQWRMYDQPVLHASQIESEVDESDAVELSPAEESFLSAARAGRLAAVQSFLRSAGPRSVNLVSSSGETALILACKHGRQSVADYLLAKVAPGRLNIHARDRLGKNALNYAAENGQKDITMSGAGDADRVLACLLSPAL
jgi:hypothetical protein